MVPHVERVPSARRCKGQRAECNVPTGHELPRNGVSQPASQPISHSMTGTGNRVRNPKYALRTTNYQLPTTNYQISNLKFQLRNPQSQLVNPHCTPSSLVSSCARYHVTCGRRLTTSHDPRATPRGRRSVSVGGGNGVAARLQIGRTWLAPGGSGPLGGHCSCAHVSTRPGTTWPRSSAGRFLGHCLRPSVHRSIIEQASGCNPQIPPPTY